MSNSLSSSGGASLLSWSNIEASSWMVRSSSEGANLFPQTPYIQKMDAWLHVNISLAKINFLKWSIAIWTMLKNVKTAVSCLTWKISASSQFTWKALVKSFMQVLYTLPVNFARPFFRGQVSSILFDRLKVSYFWVPNPLEFYPTACSVLQPVKKSIRF